jgi:hypothetical protein
MTRLQEGESPANPGRFTPLATDWDSENALGFQGVVVATPALQNAMRRSGAKKVSNINMDEY